MEKAEHHIQSEYARNAYILPDCNDICNADITKLAEIFRCKRNRKAARKENRSILCLDYLN